MTSIYIREKALVYMILAEQKPISEKSILPYGVGLQRQKVGIPGSSIVYHHSLTKYEYEMEDVWLYPIFYDWGNEKLSQPLTKNGWLEQQVYFSIVSEYRARDNVYYRAS